MTKRCDCINIHRESSLLNIIFLIKHRQVYIYTMKDNWLAVSRMHTQRPAEQLWEMVAHSHSKEGTSTWAHPGCRKLHLCCFYHSLEETECTSGDNNSGDWVHWICWRCMRSIAAASINHLRSVETFIMWSPGTTHLLYVSLMHFFFCVLLTGAQWVSPRVLRIGNDGFENRFTFFSF